MKVAVVRVRGTLKLSKVVAETFRMLNLSRPNQCVVLELTPVIEGMLKRIAHHATWGPVDEKVLSELRKKGDKIFSLNPPKKGYGKKGVKIPFRHGGALGDRKEKINDLLVRML